jgi:transcriptional regulator with PAS, ATPase and Fis domain
MPLGSTETRNSRFRIISAANKGLKELVEKGFMRDDFFYRIHVISITVPPLRERKEDIPLLIDHFLRLCGHEGGSSIPSKVIESLVAYDWPGNVRELQNVLHRYLTVKHLDFMDMPRSPAISSDKGSTDDLDLEGLSFHCALKGFEKRLILKALEYNQWHKAKAASHLGLPRRTFFRKLKYLGIT